MELLVSYAQFDEDVILQRALRNVSAEEIFFIDVGSNDPVFDSVTYTFYLRGSRGINVEPQIEYKRDYERERPGDTSLFVGVSNKKGHMMMYGSGQSATLDSGGIYASGEGRDVEITTLDDIIQEHVPVSQTIHFIKIDVEGFEKQVLEGIDLSKHRPWIFCIESMEPGTEEDTHGQWEHILLKSRYRFAYNHGVNRYYCAEEMDEVFGFLSSSDEIFNSFHIIKMDNYKQMYESLVNSRSFKLISLLLGIKSKFKISKG